MSVTETTIDAILDAIKQEIAERERMANNAMHTLRKFNPTTEEYKDANLQFGVNTYIACYLKRIQNVVMGRNPTAVESAIRFHHYQQHAKGNLDDHRDISLGQAAVAVILGGYIERFFD